MNDDLYERLMEARDLLWEAAVRLKMGQPEPQAEVNGSDVVDMAEVHRLMELP